MYVPSPAVVLYPIESDCEARLIAVPLATVLVITPLKDPVVALTVPPDWLVAVVAVVALVAVEAFPLNVAVIVPALKLPEASRATIALAVFALVAVVAELGILAEAVNAPVPLPYTYPVRVVAPVPPAATGSVPAAKADELVEYRALFALVNVVRPVPP